MRAAIPVFGSRVSPRFDCGTALLVADIHNGEVVTTEQLVNGATNALQRIGQLRELGVEVVVCGAITGFVLRHLAANGIRVYSGVFCEAGEALAALARGESPPTPSPPMGVRRGRGRGRGRRGRYGSRRPL